MREKFYFQKKCSNDTTENLSENSLLDSSFCPIGQSNHLNILLACNVMPLCINITDDNHSQYLLGFSVAGKHVSLSSPHCSEILLMMLHLSPPFPSFLLLLLLSFFLLPLFFLLLILDSSTEVNPGLASSSIYEVQVF